MLFLLHDMFLWMENVRTNMLNYYCLPYHGISELFLLNVCILAQMCSGGCEMSIHVKLIASLSIEFQGSFLL